jgi:preprotein translocase subunit SecG
MSQNLLNGLMVAQILIGILIVVSILLQNRGEGIGEIFGGGGGGEHFRTRRGLESFLYYGTIALIVVFACLSFVIVKFSI